MRKLDPRLRKRNAAIVAMYGRGHSIIAVGKLGVHVGAMLLVACWLPGLAMSWFGAVWLLYVFFGVAPDALASAAYLLAGATTDARALPPAQDPEIDAALAEVERFLAEGRHEGA